MTVVSEDPMPLDPCVGAQDHVRRVIPQELLDQAVRVDKGDVAR
jgi:hypothetical protein